MRNTVWRCLLGMLLAVPLQAGAGAGDGYEALMTMRVDGDITIDAAGRVAGYHLKTGIEPALKTLIAGSVPHWKFDPVLLDGTPVAAKSKMRITLRAKEKDGGYVVAIDNAIFHDEDSAEGTSDGFVSLRVARKTRLPAFPNYSVNGLVVVTVLLSPDGKVDDILAAQTTFLNAKGDAGSFDRARKQMEDNAVRAIRSWAFDVDVAKGVAPRPEQLTGTILVDYRMFGSGNAALRNPGTWRHETRTAMKPIPWIPDSRVAQTVRASDLDEAMPMLPNASPLRLRDGALL